MDAVVRFLEEIVNLVENAERHYGIANMDYTTYILERFEHAIISCCDFRDKMCEENLDTVISEYFLVLCQLIDSLRTLHRKWEEYECSLDMQTFGDNSYPVAVEYSGAPGRPKFDISRDQLTYLSSLFFKWTEIADLLGVSRMTVYRLKVNIMQN